MVGDARRSTWGLIQRAHDRFYERFGSRGLVVAGTIGAMVSLSAISELVIAAGAGFLSVPLRDLTWWWWAGPIGCVLSIALGELANLRRLRTVVEWSELAPTPDRAAELWELGTILPRRLTIHVAVVLYIALMTAGVPMTIARYDLPLWTFGVMALTWATLLASGSIFFVLGLELLFRPQMRDVAEHLAPEHEPTTRGLSLRSKVSTPVPGAICFAVLFTTAFADTSASYGTRVLVGVTLGLVFAGVTMTLYLIAVHAALDPVDQLTEATERVRHGDLTTPVPLVGADELGRLATSFNQMLEGLRERETLREHNAELLADVQASRARIVAAADDERRRMERDIHDGAQQRLVLINLKLGMLSKTLESDPAAAKALLTELRDDASHAIDELRDLAHGIYPALLESDGLAAALSDVGDQSRFPVSVTDDGTTRYPAEVEAAVYFCCMEALQNCAKHAGEGSHARIELSQTDRTLHFVVRDDGRGFDRASVNGSAGLQNMADRIGALGGQLLVSSTPGEGTTVEGTVPV
ncbi:MAG TPA: sensor histidine kinase [Nocardioidaceae bacterium]|nr:sensor histidine kinase [Nocardioidaceae bacterium]